MLYRPGELWLTASVNRLSSMAFTANDKEIAHEHADQGSSFIDRASFPEPRGLRRYRNVPGSGRYGERSGIAAATPHLAADHARCHRQGMAGRRQAECGRWFTGERLCDGSRPSALVIRSAQ